MQFDLIVFGFAYILFNDGTLVKNDETKAPIVANDKGKVKLEVAAETKVGNKTYKPGETAEIKLETIQSWVEETDWIETPTASTDGAKVEESEEQKQARKDKAKELKKAVDAAQMAVLGAKPEDFTKLKAAYEQAKNAYDTFTASTSKKKGSTAAAVVYTEDEKKHIAEYEAKRTSFETAKTTLATTKAAMDEAKKALPASYKTKGHAGTGTGGGEKPPKADEAIRAKMYQSFKDGAGKKTISDIAREFGYSAAYANHIIKKMKATEEAAVAKAKAEAEAKGGASTEANKA